MTASYDSLRKEALEALVAQDARKAFTTFRPVLAHPGAPELREPARWTEAWDTFARIATAIAGEPFAEHVRRAAREPDDAQALYDLGYELFEQSLHDLAATVLSRAHGLVPHEESILHELVSALEGLGAHAEAARLLRASPLAEERFMTSYLLGYNALMSGDLDEPRRRILPLEKLRLKPDALPDWPAERLDALDYMVGRLRGFLARADALRGVSPLDMNDLRGWHFVATGGLLLHLSPYGFDDGMRGRYAFVQDSESLCLEGIRRVEAVLNPLGLMPPRVFVLPDRDSAILAQATARGLGLPTVPWPEKGSEAPGLVVAYDLSTLDDALLRSLRRHRPGQVLWGHAACWTQEGPFAADLVTFFYQANTSPWGAALRMNPESGKVERTTPDERPVEELAERLAQAKLEPSALEDLPVLVRLARAMSLQQDGAAGGLFHQSGDRPRQIIDSPVKSSRFA